MALGEALQDRREDVAPGRGRRGQAQGPALSPPERLELLLHGLELVEHARRVGGDDLAGLREPAGAAPALDELLADRGLERLEVLRGGRLAHARGLGRGRDRSAPPDVDEQAEAGGIERVDYSR